MRLFPVHGRAVFRIFLCISNFVQNSLDRFCLFIALDLPKLIGPGLWAHLPKLMYWAGGTRNKQKRQR